MSGGKPRAIVAWLLAFSVSPIVHEGRGEGVPKGTPPFTRLSNYFNFDSDGQFYGIPAKLVNLGK